MKSADVMRAAALTTFVAALAACGGGGGGGGGSPTPNTGVFIDAAVEGLSYSATPSGLSGITNADGEFQYEDGDTVAFSLGNVQFGSATPEGGGGTAVVTPATLADGDPAVATNISRFLQTFDDDGNPDNGITIPAAVATAATQTVDFAAADFDAEAGFADLAEEVGAAVVTEEAADAHSERTFLSQIAGTWAAYDEEADALIPLTVTFYADGTYVKGGQEDSSECSVGYEDARPDGNGVEWGRFDYDASAGTFQVQASFFDNDGDCGLFERNQEEQDLYDLVLDGDSLRFSPNSGSSGDPDDFELRRVPTSTGIVGSWEIVENGRPIVFTFFPDDTYVMAHVSPGESGLDSDTAAGTEVGTWDVGANNVLSTTQEIDTNSDGGLSDLAEGTTLRVVAGQLVLEVPDEGAFTLDRLPRQEVINVGDLTGAWFVAEAGDTAATAAAAGNYVAFFADGTYLFGNEGNDSNCVEDYGNDGTVGVDGEGAEGGSWILDSGSGVARFFNAFVDSNGSCGLYDRRDNGTFARGGVEENTLIATKGADVDTISVSVLDVDNDRDLNGDLVREEFELKRVPSQANSLVGAWREDTTGEVLYFFADGSFAFVFPLEGGSFERGTWELVGNDLTLAYASGGEETDEVTFNGDFTVFTTPSDGEGGDPEQGFTYRKIR